MVYSRGFGFSDLGTGRSAGEQETVHSSTIFKIGSVSKLFTATGIVMLAQEGRLSLDDQLQKFCPKYQGTGITIRSLLTHYAGLVKVDTNHSFFLFFVIMFSETRSGQSKISSSTEREGTRRRTEHRTGSSYVANDRLYAQTHCSITPETVERRERQKINQLRLIKVTKRIARSLNNPHTNPPNHSYRYSNLGLSLSLSLYLSLSLSLSWPSLVFG